MTQSTILRALKKNKSFLISTHVNPDPDALCSQLALALYLKSLNKKVFVVNEETIPQRFKFIPSSELLQKVTSVKNIAYDIAVIVDCGDLARIGKVSTLLDPSKPIINIDHHITNDRFGDLNLIDPKASSTAEMLYDLFAQAKAKLTKPMAVLLYMGIMTDTGSFRYDSTTAHTHQAVAGLMKFEFSVSDLYRRMYERVSLSDLRMLSVVLQRVEVLHDGRVICVDLPKNILKKFSEHFDVRDKVFSLLRSVKDVEVIVIYSDHEKGGATRVNLRSQGNTVNVADLAAYFGGGGHRKASGCVIQGTLKKAKKILLSRLEKML